MFEPFAVIAYNFDGWEQGGSRIHQVRRALFIREVTDRKEKDHHIPGSSCERIYEAIDLEKGYEYREPGVYMYLRDCPEFCIRLIRQLSKEECLTHPLQSIREAAKSIVNK